MIEINQRHVKWKGGMGGDGKRTVIFDEFLVAIVGVEASNMSLILPVEMAEKRFV